MSKENNPKNEELWATEMGRDNLGDNIPPDEINIVHLNKNYGWPYCFGDKVHDDTFDPLNTHRCDNTQPPVYEIPAHSAPLGLVFINSPQFPNDWQGDLLVSHLGHLLHPLVPLFPILVTHFKHQRPLRHQPLSHC